MHYTYADEVNTAILKFVELGVPRSVFAECNSANPDDRTDLHCARDMLFAAILRAGCAAIDLKRVEPDPVRRARFALAAAIDHKHHYPWLDLAAVAVCLKSEDVPAND